MAGKGISINFLADVRQFLRGTDNVADALEDVSDSLDDMARDGEKATEKLERSFKDLTRTAERESKETGREISRNIDRGTRDAAESFDELKSEAGSTAREAAASFDGSADSITDAFQEVAANAFGGFGPAGAAAGIVAAAGLGVVTAELAKQEESTQRLKQYFADAYKTAAEEGRKYIDQATIQAEAQDILFNPDREAELNQLKKDAIELGLREQTLLLARAGDQEALNEVLAVSQQKYNDASQALTDYIEKNGTAMPADSLLVAEQAEADRLLGRYEQVQAEIDKNVGKQEAAAGIIDALEQRTQDAINRSRAVNAARADSAIAQAARVRQAGPVIVPMQFQVPDAAAVRSALQRKINGLPPVRVDAAVYTRNGTPVY